MSVVLYCPARAWRNALFMYLEDNEKYLPLAFTVAVLAYACLRLIWELRSRAAAPVRTIEKIKAERSHVEHAILSLEQHLLTLDAELGALSPSLDKRPAKRARLMVPDPSRR